MYIAPSKCQHLCFIGPSLPTWKKYAFCFASLVHLISWWHSTSQSVCSIKRSFPKFLIRFAPWSDCPKAAASTKSLTDSMPLPASGSHWIRFLSPQIDCMHQVHPIRSLLKKHDTAVYCIFRELNVWSTTAATNAECTSIPFALVYKQVLRCNWYQIGTNSMAYNRFSHALDFGSALVHSSQLLSKFQKNHDNFFLF